VAFPFVEEGLIRVMLPSVEVRDEAALGRRRDVIVKILLAAIRPESASRGTPPRGTPPRVARPPRPR
jgi:hypothetical protein